MAYDEGLAQRIREILSDRKDVIEKKMFGGMAFLLSGHMCAGVLNDELMARVGPDQYEGALREPHVREMDFTGKSLRGFVYVGPQGIIDDRDLIKWMERCIQFVSSLPPK